MIEDGETTVDYDVIMSHTKIQNTLTPGEAILEWNLKLEMNEEINTNWRQVAWVEIFVWIVP